MKLTDVKKILLKKAAAILLIGLLGALCAFGFKFLFTPATYIKGDFIYNRIIQVENLKDLTNPNFEFNYIGIINTNNSILKFIEKTDDKVFDYSKINSRWKRINRQEQVGWLRGRIRMYNYRDNVYEIVFSVPSSYVSDISYLSKNVGAFMDAFVLNGHELILGVKPHAIIKTVNSTMLLPEELNNDKKAIALKYAIYGFIAGAFLSIAVFIGVPFFKELQKSSEI